MKADEWAKVSDVAQKTITASMVAGMMTALEHWPTIRTPAQTEQEAQEDHAMLMRVIDGLSGSSQLKAAFPIERWTEGYIRGYTWMSGQLIELWGMGNWKLLAALRAQEH